MSVVCDSVTITPASPRAPGFIVPGEQETLIRAASVTLYQSLDLDLTRKPISVDPAQPIAVANKIAVTELYLIFQEYY